MTSSVSLSSVMCKRAAASLFCQEHVFLLSLSAPVSCHDVTDINQTRSNHHVCTAESCLGEPHEKLVSYKPLARFYQSAPTFIHHTSTTKHTQTLEEIATGGEANRDERRKLVVFHVKRNMNSVVSFGQHEVTSQRLFPLKFEFKTRLQ